MKIPIAKLLSIVSIPLIILSVVLAAIYFNRNHEAVSLPDYGKLSSFQLIDSKGEPYDSASLLGQPWIASFVFSRCQNQTPPMVKKMKKLSGLFPELRFVSITVDPEFDQPEVLDQFMKRGQGPQHWSFLTGDKAKIDQVAQSLNLPVPSNPMLHSTRFVLVDSEGHIRGFYDSQSPMQLSALEVDIRGL